MHYSTSDFIKNTTVLKFNILKMRFAYLGIACSSTLALRVNFNSKNPSCVHNVDDCNSLNGDCCANQEMCGVQGCFQRIINFVKWGAPSRWSLGPNSARSSI